MADLPSLDPELVASLTRIREEREQDEAEERQRNEEKRQRIREMRREIELRRAQMTPEERDADIEDEKRRIAKWKRRKETKGLDLIEMVFKGETLGTGQQAAVLGQTPFTPDQTRFLKSLKGYRNEMGDIGWFQSRVCIFSDLDLYWASAELCKFALCDWRVPRDRKDYNSAGLEEMYQKQLRRVRENDRYEQAPALIRPKSLKAAQHWARKMLDIFETAAAKGEEVNALQAWIGIRYRPPPWVNNNTQSKEDYGFFIYKSNEAESRPAVAKERWFQVFNPELPEIPEDLTDPLDEDSFPSYQTVDVLGEQGLSPYMHPSWVPACPVHGFPSEQTPSAFREHFKTMENTNPRILGNTFLVLTNDCIFPELDTHELNYDGIHAPSPGKVRPEQLPKFFLWAYDANWEPSTACTSVLGHESLVEGCNCGGVFTRGYGSADEDGYEGRVKVSINDLFCWFYYAKTHGVSLKDLWRKAQGMEDQVWWSKGAYWDPSLPEWLV